MYYVIMTRALQYILHLPLFRIVLPANCASFFESTLLIAMFDFVEQFWDWDTQDVI